MGNIYDPLTRQAYSRDPRHVALKAVAYLKSTGIADTAYFGPEAEFFVFDAVQYQTDQRSSHYRIDSGEGLWNAAELGLGHQSDHKRGYFPVAPTTNSYRRLVPGYEAPVVIAYSAMLMAGLDGVKNRIDPGEPADVDLYEDENSIRAPTTSGSLAAVLDALEADHAFLLEGDALTTDLLEAYIGYKREVEVDGVRLRPHPYEFSLYYGI